MEGLVSLGKTEIRISPMGVGTWQWGDYFIWRYGKGYSNADLREAFQVSLKAGINFFDTAEVYGRGRSERLLGEFLTEASVPGFRRFAEDYLVEPTSETSCRFTWVVAIEPAPSGRVSMPVNRRVLGTLFRDTRRHYGLA